MKKVIALTGNSLLVQGLVSRLREYSHVFDLRVVDLATPDSLQQVAKFQPEIIIFEAGDLNDARHPSLADFLNTLPQVILVELRLDDPSVQLIQSTRFKAHTTDDLVQIFRTNDNISTFSNTR